MILAVTANKIDQTRHDGSVTDTQETEERYPAPWPDDFHKSDVDMEDALSRADSTRRVSSESMLS